MPHKPYFAKYLPVEGFEHYEISEEGYIRNTKHKKDRKYNILHGYKYVSMKKDGKIYNKRVHILVAKAFIPNPNNLPVVAHIDHDRLNCHKSNLKWCSQQDNIKDMYSEGRGATGEKQGNSVLTTDIVIAIRREYSKGTITFQNLADKYNTSTAQISRIINNQIWKYI